jgi:hypothetical protein
MKANIWSIPDWFTSWVLTDFAGNHRFADKQNESRQQSDIEDWRLKIENHRAIPTWTAEIDTLMKLMKITILYSIKKEFGLDFDIDVIDFVVEMMIRRRTSKSFLRNYRGLPGGFQCFSHSWK